MNATTEIDVTSAKRAHVRDAAALARHTPLISLHPGILAIAAAGYIALIGVLVIGFAGPQDLGVPLGIVIVCLVAFIGLPLFMGRNAASFWRRHGESEPAVGGFRHFLNSRFETGGGSVSGVGALALVTTVPIALSLGAIAMVIIFKVV